MNEFPVIIIGGGILGVNLAYQLSLKYDGRQIAVLEKEDEVARHTSGRNTGVIHRPFYLDPVVKKKFASAAQASYYFWQAYAQAKGLPWRQVGTIEIATTADEFDRLKKYKIWSEQNGMHDDEVRVLSAEETKKIEPNLRCAGALLCTTDTSVDFAAFTRSLKEDAVRRGVQFITGAAVDRIETKENNWEIFCGQDQRFSTRYLINCAGGRALALARSMGAACEYADLNFRGDYWVVEGDSARLASHNIYSVPRNPAFPFLDPHYIVRADGRVEIGPTAVPVFGPYAYRGSTGRFLNFAKKICEPPLLNKLRLTCQPEFIDLCFQEWRSAFSKRALVARVQKFLPDLRVQDCVRRGKAGIRSSLVDRRGAFVKEVLEVLGRQSLHILNYNSPGATGSPAYAAYLVNLLAKKGALDHAAKRPLSS